MQIPSRLETSRLILIPLQFTDSNDINQAVRESLPQLSPWHAWAIDTYTLRNTQEHVQQAVSAHREGTGVTYIFRGKSGRFMGEVTLNEVPDSMGRSVPAFQLGFWVRSSEQGNGYQAEALKAVTQHAFDILHARRVEVRLHSGNTHAAQAVANAGFAVEATLHHTQRGDNDTVADTLVYSIVR